MTKIKSLRKRMAGVTLLELMVVITIIGISLALAAPGFSSLITSTRLSSQANDIVADVRLARSEAGSRGAWIVICPSSDGGVSCSTSTSDWRKGRIVFVDSDRSTTRATTETVLKYTETLSGNTTVTVSGFTDVPLTFSPYGGLLQGGVPGGSGSFKLCSASSTAGRLINVDFSGRPSATKTTCP